MQGCDLEQADEFALDEEQKKESWKNRPVYTPPVRIGNWNEDMFLIEEQTRVANYKQDHCQLLIQKTRKMFKNLLNPVILASEAPFVQYGSTYQIQACDLLTEVEPKEGTIPTYGLYLSGVMNEKDIEIAQHFIHGCGLTLSPDKSPCVRNTFIFVGCDGQSDDQTIYYGDDVFIRIYETGTDGHLYIQCENSSIDNFGGVLPLRLTQSPDVYCRFKILHWDPKYRYETVGGSFPPNTRVLIQHTASGQNLGAKYTEWIPTFFGAECSVCCQTFRNTHKMETAENMFKIISHVLPDKNLYVRAAKGEDIPPDLLV